MSWRSLILYAISINNIYIDNGESQRGMSLQGISEATLKVQTVISADERRQKSQK